MFDYFKHSFAQVTNPPLDSIRENFVMSLECPVGQDSNLLEINKDRTNKIIFQSPVLSRYELSLIRDNHIPELKSSVLDATFAKTDNRNMKDIILDRYNSIYDQIIKNNSNTIILSDRNVDKDNVQIPSILMTSALHNFLLDKKIRNNLTIIVETGGIRESHHYCCLLGFGADGISPYMAYKSIKNFLNKKNISFDVNTIFESVQNI